MTVETQYVEVRTGASEDDAGSAPRIAARTTIKFDGDSVIVVPLVTNDRGALEVDTALYELHERNVALTTEYRAKMLASLNGLLQGARRR
jgi:hypothetical protein